MSRKNGAAPAAKGRISALSLVPQPGSGALSQRLPSNQGMTALPPHATLTRDQRRVVEEVKKQLLVIEGTRIKGLLAQNASADLVEHFQATIDHHIGRMRNRQRLTRHPEHQADMDEITSYLVPVLVAQLREILEASHQAIKDDGLTRSAYVEYREPGFLDRLFGLD
jgi:hypothetical protein